MVDTECHHTRPCLGTCASIGDTLNIAFPLEAELAKISAPAPISDASEVPAAIEAINTMTAAGDYVEALIWVGHLRVWLEAHTQAPKTCSNDHAA
jgi:hypothetical protein